MDWQFDKRILERNIQKGLLTQKDLEKRLKSLPDLASQVAAGENEEDSEENDDSKE